MKVSKLEGFHFRMSDINRYLDSDSFNHLKWNLSLNLDWFHLRLLNIILSTQFWETNLATHRFDDTGGSKSLNVVKYGFRCSKIWVLTRDHLFQWIWKPIFMIPRGHNLKTFSKLLRGDLDGNATWKKPLTTKQKIYSERKCFFIRQRLISKENQKFWTFK